MALVEVVHHWDDSKGNCYDCGAPAAYSVSDLYRAEGEAPRRENLMCSVCAAYHAADGYKLIRLFYRE